MPFNSAQEVLGALVHAYYDERDIEATLSCVTDDIEWVGTENNDSAKGKAALRKLLEADVAVFPDPFEIILDEPDVQSLGPEAVVITVTGEQIAVPGVIAGFAIRGTACCVKTKNGWLIANVHTSVPNSEIEKIYLQNELNAEREKQVALLKNVPGGVTTFRLKKDGHVYTEYISDGLAKLCGYNDGKEFMSKIADNTSRFVVGDDFQIVEEACKKMVINGGTDSISYRFYNRAGKIIWLQLDFVAMTQIPLAEDDVAVFYGVQTLVSEDVLRAKTEQDYYRMVLNLTQTAYFEVDENGNLYSSESFANYKISNYGLSAIMGSQEAQDCFHPDDRNNLFQYLKKINNGENGKSVIVRTLMQDGNYQWTEISAHLEREEECKNAPQASVAHIWQHKIRRMTGILRNVNPEWEKQKAALEQALGETKQANKAKTDFLSNMSHDMRTPMNAIIGLSNLAMDLHTEEELKDYMSKINSSGKQLLALINDTLDVSRIENGKLTMNREYVMSKQLLWEGVVSTKVVAEHKGVHFHMEQEDFRDALLYVDAVKITKLFTNLLSNAVKFTAPGGEVIFFIKRLGEENRVARYYIEIRDTGIGMSKAFLGHIFDPFAQECTGISTNATGTGLGMTIVKEFVDFLGAKMEIDSELGKGTKVKVWIDFEIADKAPEEQNPVMRTLRCDTHRILVAEDHPLNAEIMKKLLEKKGYPVEIACNGKECVSKFLSSDIDHYGLILMDIRMPEMDGLEATRAIRYCDRPDAAGIPIVAMTANAFAQDVKASLAAGMNGHLSKPVEPEKLYYTLEKFLRDKKQ